jgi:hypothetical protein
MKPFSFFCCKEQAEGHVNICEARYHKNYLPSHIIDSSVYLLHIQALEHRWVNSKTFTAALAKITLQPQKLSAKMPSVVNINKFPQRSYIASSQDPLMLNDFTLY